MYFLVLNTQNDKFEVVPAKWIKTKFESIVNYFFSVNRVYICYIGNDQGAWDNGFPNKEFVPNFNNMDGCFKVKIIKYFGKILNI
jgi:hypothetical protein